MNDPLLKYIGWKWNFLTKNTIEIEFFPKKVILRDTTNFDNENFIRNGIRCLVVNELITKLSFN
jgi:hypothetical protein